MYAVSLMYAVKYVNFSFVFPGYQEYKEEKEEEEGTTILVGKEAKETLLGSESKNEEKATICARD